MRRIAAVLILLQPLAARPLAADDIQSWTDVEFRLLESDRIAWTAGGVARIRDSLGSVYDRRAQTDVDLVLTDPLSVTLGYILRNRVRTGFGFGWDHRLRAGLTYPLLRRSVRVEGTTLYERHIGRPDVPDFNRYRQQIELERPPRAGVPVALPVGGVQTSGIRAIPVEDGCPLEIHVRSLDPSRVSVRVDQGRRDLAAAPCHLLGVELRSDRQGNGRAVAGECCSHRIQRDGLIQRVEPDRRRSLPAGHRISGLGAL